MATWKRRHPSGLLPNAICPFLKFTQFQQHTVHATASDFSNIVMAQQSNDTRCKVAIPAIYRFTFTWQEPISCLVGFWTNTFDLDGALNIYVPAEFSARDPSHDVLFSLVGGAMLCFAVLHGVLLRYTDDVNVWKIVNGGLLGWDICVLCGSYTMLAYQGRLDPSSWRVMDWAQIGLTTYVGVLRALFVAGVGLGGSSAKSHGRTARKVD